MKQQMHFPSSVQQGKPSLQVFHWNISRSRLSRHLQNPNPSSSRKPTWKKAQEAQSAKISTLKKQLGAQGALASAEPAAPGAADCTPGAVECSKKRKAKGKKAEAAPDGKSSEEPMTPGTADF